MDIDDAIGDRDEPEDRMDYDAGNDDMYYTLAQPQILRWDLMSVMQTI